MTTLLTPFVFWFSLARTLFSWSFSVWQCSGFFTNLFYLFFSKNGARYVYARMYRWCVMFVYWIIKEMFTLKVKSVLKVYIHYKTPTPHVGLLLSDHLSNLWPFCSFASSGEKGQSQVLRMSLYFSLGILLFKKLTMLHGVQWPGSSMNFFLANFSLFATYAHVYIFCLLIFEWNTMFY